MSHFEPSIFAHGTFCCSISLLSPEMLQERVSFICAWRRPAPLSWSWTASDKEATQCPRAPSAFLAESLCYTSPSVIFRSLDGGVNLSILYFKIRWTLSSTFLDQGQKLCLRQLSTLGQCDLNILE